MKIEIKDEIIEKIKKKIEGTAFKEPKAYIEYILNDVVAEDSDLSEEDEEKVRERLRALGYMD